MADWPDADALRFESSKKIAELIRIQIVTGITYSRVAEQRTALEKRASLLVSAERALNTANSWMWRIRIDHDVFDALTADLDSLRQKIDALKAEQLSMGKQSNAR
jgi:hypothetical protein